MKLSIYTGSVNSYLARGVTGSAVFPIINKGNEVFPPYGPMSRRLYECLNDNLEESNTSKAIFWSDLPVPTVNA